MGCGRPPGRKCGRRAQRLRARGQEGWAPAALALALTYDPHELTRRGVQIAADPAKARGCYMKARELMNAMVAYYLSRLPPATGESC